MPYAFAHPAAAVPAHRLLGRHAVASALVLGSLVPDLWYAIPGLDRPHTHGATSLLWFCPLAGLLAYVAWHLLFKQPLAALLPQAMQSRLQPLLAPGLPRRRWSAVGASLLVGSVTHLAWDALTHAGVLYRSFPFLNAHVDMGELQVRLQQLLQHGSTLAGTVFLAWWCARWLRKAPPLPLQQTAFLPPRWKVAVVMVTLAAAAVSFHVTWNGATPATVDELRPLAKASAFASAGAGGMALLAYCAAWKLLRAARRRSGEARRQAP